jgi:hypothetical protein
MHEALLAGDLECSWEACRIISATYYGSRMRMDEFAAKDSLICPTIVRQRFASAHRALTERTRTGSMRGN